MHHAHIHTRIMLAYRCLSPASRNLQQNLCRYQRVMTAPVWRLTICTLSFSVLNPLHRAAQVDLCV